MSFVTNLALAPFALVLRQAYAWPWTTIALSAVLGILAELLHRDIWMASFACFGAYILMWLDEAQHPHALELGSDENIE